MFFSFLDVEKQAEISKLITDDELSYIVNELYFDDKIDLIEEMPANVVKKNPKKCNGYREKAD